MKDKPETPDNIVTRTAGRFLAYTQSLHKKPGVKPPAESIYGDLTNRLFALAVDLVVLIYPLTIFTNIVVMVAFDVYQYDATIIKISQTVSPEVFQSLLHDGFKMNQFIAQNYPSDAVIIFQQLLFIRGMQIFLFAVYVIFFIYKFGATPGKMLLGLKVVDKITGGKLSFSQTCIRFIGYALALPLGLLAGAARHDKRCWHDFMADSVVIYTPDRWYKKSATKITGRVKKFLNKN